MMLLIVLMIIVSDLSPRTSLLSAALRQEHQSIICEYVCASSTHTVAMCNFICNFSSLSSLIKCRVILLLIIIINLVSLYV